MRSVVSGDQNAEIVRLQSQVATLSGLVTELTTEVACLRARDRSMAVGRRNAPVPALDDELEALFVAPSAV
jgi:hypothetical protein